MSSSGEKVESFEKLTITNSTMCGIYEYEAVNTDRNVDVAYYSVYYKDGKSRRLLEKASCDSKTFMEILDKCGILGWNGFHGKRPEGVLDGVTFQAEAVVNGRSIFADGSENFPAGYHELMNEIYDMLRNSQDSVRD